MIGVLPLPLRSSFRARLLAALLVTVVFVLGLALFAVRRETERQIVLATERITARSHDAFRQLEQLQHDELARLAAAFTESPRTFALLEAVLETPAAAHDRAWLIEAVQYELELQRMTSSLASFTDASGTPTLTLLHGEDAGGAAAPAIRTLARTVLEPAGVEVSDEPIGRYAVVRGELFAVQVRRLALGGTTIGAVVLGLPIDDDVAQRLGETIGVELCFGLRDRCLAATSRARGELAPALTRSPRGGPPRLVYVEGGRWEVLTDALATDRPDEAWRAIALSVDGVLAPFDRIHRTLLRAGALALGFAVLLGLLLARGFGRPIRALVDATARVASGDYTSRVRVGSADELGRLATAFNHMTEGLELKERYRGVLDKVVSREVAEVLLGSEMMLGGETRDVTTLFADLVSFTPHTEGMEPQRVIALLNDSMARLASVVERHDAVVDKFLGDGLMALFGAPVQHTDDPTRAVVAALEMQGAMRELHQYMAARGEVPLQLAIGIASGPVVAGNLGSPNRLEYTVVGESVNLAARLCAIAGPGEILVSEDVRQRVGDAIAMRPLGPRSIKGFSRTINVFAVTAESLSDGDRRTFAGTSREAGVKVDTRTDHTDPPTLGRTGRLALLLVALSPFAGPAVGRAQQTGGLPTLDDLGLHYRSEAGHVEVGFSGRLDLEAFVPQDDPTWLIPATEPFVAGRLRLFADLFVGDHVYGLVELRADRGQAPHNGSVEGRVQQAFVRIAAPGRGRVRIQAGKFALPIGGFPERHQTPEDAFIRPPLLYDHHTIVAPRVAPGVVGGFLGWKDEDGRRERGTPIFWAVPYPWGALVAAGAGPLDLRFGAASAPPSGAPSTWRFDAGRFEHPTLVAAAGLRITPELRVNAYGARGPYLEELETGSLPPGTRLEDFTQRLAGADIVFMRSHLVLRGELYANEWEVPNIDQPVRDLSYSAEGKLKLTPGLFTAVRFGGIRFNRLRPAPAAPADRWDHDIQRIQIAAGYRIVRNAEVRAEYLINRSAAADPRDNLTALQVWWMF